MLCHPADKPAAPRKEAFPKNIGTKRVKTAQHQAIISWPSAAIGALRTGGARQNLLRHEDETAMSVSDVGPETGESAQIPGEAGFLGDEFARHDYLAIDFKRFKVVQLR